MSSQLNSMHADKQRKRFLCSSRPSRTTQVHHSVATNPSEKSAQSENSIKSAISDRRFPRYGPPSLSGAGDPLEWNHACLVFAGSAGCGDFGMLFDSSSLAGWVFELCAGVRQLRLRFRLRPARPPVVPVQEEVARLRLPLHEQLRPLRRMRRLLHRLRQLVFEL